MGILSGIPYYVNVVSVTLLTPQSQAGGWSCVVGQGNGFPGQSVYAVSLPHWLGDWTPDVLSAHSANLVNPPATVTISN